MVRVRPLFATDIQEIHVMVSEKMRAIEEQSYSWLNEVLEEAKKAFGQADAPCLLPKTPSAKRRARKKKSTSTSAQRKIQLDDQDDYVAPEQKPVKATKGSRKRVPTVTLSDDEDFEDVVPNKVLSVEDPDESTPPTRGRRTRATASRAAATTSRAKNSRAKKSRKVKSQEPVKNILDTEEDTTDTDKPVDNLTSLKKCEIRLSRDEVRLSNSNTENKNDTIEDEVVMEEWSETWTQRASAGELHPKHCLPSKDIVKTPTNKTVQNTSKTPIQNFGLMNVKDKVQAYEEIILISPSTPCNPHGTDCVQSDNDVNMTPTGNKLSPQQSPSTIVNTKTMSCLSVKTPPNSVIDSPEVVKQSSNKKATPRLSRTSQPSRKSYRKSMRTSLKVLPSTEKAMQLHTEVNEKPIRTRTRLRLKKKEVKTDNVDDDTASSCDDRMETDSQDGTMSDPTIDHVDGSNTTASTRKSQDENEEPVVRSSTRTKTRHASKADNSAPLSDLTHSSEEDQEAPPVVRSTRTKTRAVQNKDSGVGGSTGSIDGEASSSRSKLSKSPVTKVRSQDEVFASPAQPAPRVTRTKTRKRQLDGDGDEVREPKRSCTSSVEEKSSIRTTSTDDDSSECEMMSPPCPANKLVRPHPKSFLNNLKTFSAAKPSPKLHTGLVRSFIRNSPAPKPTQREIEARKKKELIEKQKKNEERLKKKEEERLKMMEELKKRREEKMKKVQEMRELRTKQDKDNRLLLEKKSAEKRQYTTKLKEERLREEKEKQKIRMQKMEEAEERRNNEEEERQRKLQEQLKNEKMHNDLMLRKKEFEEQERQKKIEEEKQKAIEKQRDNEREREQERDRLKQVEEERQREWQKKKEERERRLAEEKNEKERQEREKKRERDLMLKKEMDKIKEQERKRLLEAERLREQQRKQEEELKKMVDKHNNKVATAVPVPQIPKPNMNRTHSLTESTVPTSDKNDSYEMTPKRQLAASTSENYNIADLNSGDETDDEDCPRKRIPDWAQGSNLRTLLIKQHYNPPNLDLMFSYIEPPDLNVLFTKKKARFNKRTSSAHWDEPIMKPGTLGRPT